VDGSPCGAAGTHHVIWDLEMYNGCVCAAHREEIRRNWVYVGLHPYDAACAAAGRSFWQPGEDRCVLPDEDQGRAVTEVTGGVPASHLVPAAE
jgi:hypothetical protein